MEKLDNTFQALISFNTVARNIILTELAYSKGVIDPETRQKLREASKLTLDFILKNTVDKKARRIISDFRKEFFTSEVAGSNPARTIREACKK